MCPESRKRQRCAVRLTIIVEAAHLAASSSLHRSGTTRSDRNCFSNNHVGRKHVGLSDEVAIGRESRPDSQVIGDRRTDVTISQRVWARGYQPPLVD